MLSALAVGAIRWAENADNKEKGHTNELAERVMSLYIIPLCPIVNSFVLIVAISEHIFG
jgi:hypothetical protein